MPPENPGEKPSESESDSPTALLPKSILMGKEFNVGDEVVLKITHIYEDEIAVEYATGEKSKGEEPMMSDGKMDDLYD